MTLRHFTTILVAAGLLAAQPLVTLALRDPTLPPRAPQTDPDKAPQAQATWELTSILISPERRIAVINGKSLQVGQSIAGARVLSIDPHKVVLRHGSRQITLPLHQRPLKSEAPNGPQEASNQ